MIEMFFRNSFTKKICGTFPEKLKKVPTLQKGKITTGIFLFSFPMLRKKSRQEKFLKKIYSTLIFSGQNDCISCSRWENDFLWSI